jgi:hypothetical protein
MPGRAFRSRIGHGIAELQWVIDMIRLPPSPVSVPSIEVAMRLPRFVVVISPIGLAVKPHRREGNAKRRDASCAR